MNKQFVTYEISLKLKELGFDEECLSHYRSYRNEPKLIGVGGMTITQKFLDKLEGFDNEILVICPLWQQVFDWFEEKHELYVSIRPITNKGMMYDVCFREDESKSLNIPVTDLRYYPIIISYNKYSQWGLSEILTGEHPKSPTKYDCMEYSILRLIEVVKNRQNIV